MEIISFTVGPFLENTYLIRHQNQVIIVDPGFASETEYTQFRTQLEGKEIKAVLLTHAHVDHVLGLSRFLRDFKTDVYLSDADYYLWNNYSKQSAMFGIQAADFDFTPEVLTADDEISIGSFDFKTLYTPGHSPDHISFYQPEEGFLIAGDALFKEGIGRTDLYKGDYVLLEASIKEKLYTLPEHVKVYPGHGEPTTIGYEKKHNPFVRL